MRSLGWGKSVRIRRINPSPSPRRSAKIDYGESDVELTHTLQQRDFIAYHHYRLKLSLKEAAYALHQAKMRVR